MHMVAHDTKQIIVFQTIFLYFLKIQVMCLILFVDSQTSIKQLGCANTYFKYCMTNKIQYKAVVIHENSQEMIRQKQICLQDVPNFLLGTLSHFLTFSCYKRPKSLSQ